MNNTTNDVHSDVVLKKSGESEMPPEIPHITANYIPLSIISANVVQHTYSELLNLIETLPAVGSDQQRKRRLLDFIIKSRQEFVKLYVLVKWAANSHQVSKVIDANAWLNGQQNCFHNVVNVLYGIERSLGAAKLRNPDVETALEVLRTGQPFQQSHDYIPLKPLPAKSVLRTLTNLNVLLSIRLALTEELPPQYRNYEIANGKVKFTVKNCFSVDLGIADDSVDARFFLVDFAFCFRGAQPIPPGMKTKYEIAANEILGTKPLSEAFDWLLRLSQNYKLAVIHDDLKDLERGFWANVLRHAFYPDKGLILVHYWINRLGAKNTVELGLIRETNNIGIRWTRDGEIVKSHDHSFSEDQSVEQVVTKIIKDHIQEIIDLVYTRLMVVMGDCQDCVTRQGNDKIKLQLTASRSTTFSIDLQTGRCVLQNPTPIVTAAEKQLNELTDRSRIPQILAKLRYLSIQDEVTSRATAVGWVSCKNIHLSPDEVKKQFDPATKIVFALRLPAWSIKWFLLVVIGSDGLTKWFISQLEFKDNSWQVRFMEKVDLNNDDSYDYKFFDDLATFASTRIQTHALGNDLEQRNAQFVHLKSAALPTLAVEVNSLLSNEESKDNKWAHRTVYMMSSDAKLVVQGKIRDSACLKSLPASEDKSLSIDDKNGVFQVTLNSGPNALDELVIKLGQIQRVVSYIDLIKNLSLEMTDTTMKQVGFVYGQGLPVEVQLGEVIELQVGSKSPHKLVQPILQKVLNTDGLRSVIWLLKTTLPLYEALDEFQQKLDNGPIVIARSVTELKVSLPMYDIVLDISVQTLGKRQTMIFVTDVDKPMTPGAKDREQKESSPMLISLWTKKNQDADIMPLITGMSAPIEKSSVLFNQIQQALMDNTVSIE